MDRRSFVLAGAALPLAARAQSDYPNRPIRVIVPYAAGGGVDNFARPLAQKMAEQMGQPVVVENRGGGGGMIGSAQVAKAPPDGYTLLCHAQTLYLAPLMTKSPPYDAVKEFTPIVRAVTTPVVVVVHESLPVRNMKELIDYARAQPAGLDYVTASVGSQQHLTGETLAVRTKTKLVHVAYKGGHQALVDLAAGQVKMGILIMSTVLPFVQSGKLRVIAAIEGQRSTTFPDVPTAAENGLPGFAMPDTFMALYGPAGMSPAIVRRISDETKKAVESAEVRAALKTIGYEPAVTTPSEFADIARKTHAMYVDMLAETKLTI
ncbi:MAG: Bug family tripartite tricarboxylate transporter substrate binding protein [Burkholderiaceae bacterium]